MIIMISRKEKDGYQERDSPKMYESISDFANMVVIYELRDKVYQLIFTNTFSKTSYTIQITDDLFNKAFEERAVMDATPYVVKKSPQPEGMTT